MFICNTLYSTTITAILTRVPINVNIISLIKLYLASPAPKDITGAGKVGTRLNNRIDGLETKCMAMGHPFCEIITEPKKIIEVKRKEQWRKLGLI